VAVLAGRRVVRRCQREVAVEVVGAAGAALIEQQQVVLAAVPAEVREEALAVDRGGCAGAAREDRDRCVPVAAAYAVALEEQADPARHGAAAVQRHVDPAALRTGQVEDRLAGRALHGRGRGRG
jgi:hypothetical protein